MIPWYLITADDEPWKLPISLEHLGEHGIRPTVIHGINGHLAGLRPVSPHDILRDGTYDYMHPAQVGCVLSHIMALTLAVASCDTQFIIAEDDVLLRADFDAGFDQAMKALPEDAGIFQMEHLNASGQFNHGEAGICECLSAFGTACILWKRQAARQALLMLRPIDSPYDIMLIRKVYPFVRHFIVEPALVRQRTAAGEWPSSVGGKPKEVECT